MSPAGSLVAAVLMLFAFSMPIQAQDTRLRWWGVLGLGTGYAHIPCDGDGCTSGTLRGPILFGTAGFMLTPHLGVGIGLDQWWRSPSDSEATNTGTFMLHYYPSARPRAFIEAGAGLSRAEVRLDGGRHADGTGLGLMAAAGYDLHLLGRSDSQETFEVTLTPRVSYVYSSIGDLRYDASSPPFAINWRHQVLSVGLGIGFRSRR